MRKNRKVQCGAVQQMVWGGLFLHLSGSKEERSDRTGQDSRVQGREGAVY